jgi:Tfp pilus assembly protein FimT
MFCLNLGGPAQTRSDPMNGTGKHRGREAAKGFTLLEMITVVAIIFTIVAFAIISINGALPAQQANAGLNAAAQVFHQGRDSAIAERRSYQLVTTAPNQLGLQRVEIGGGFTALPTVTLPAPAVFGIDPNLGSLTVPDPNFPTCSNGLCFGGTLTQTWLSDGTFVDSAGHPLNATIYVYVPGANDTQRAFTVLGTTGRIRSYKWTGGTGGKWVLQ